MLKLYGEKEGSQGYKHIGSVFVKDNRLVVEAEDPQVKKDLEKAIETLPKDSEGNVYIQAGRVKVDIKNPRFLFVLCHYGPFNLNIETDEYPYFGGWRLEPNLSEVVNVLKKGGIEKLKLYGERTGFRGLIAAIYVKEGKLEVESQDPQIKDCILKEINMQLQRKGAFYLPWPRTKKEPSGMIIHIDSYLPQKLRDPYFLRALWAELYDRGEICGYKLNTFLSEFVEE